MICERNHVIGAGSSDEILNSLEDDPHDGGGGGVYGSVAAAADGGRNGGGGDIGGSRPNALNLGTNGIYSSHFDNGTSLCRCASKETGITDFIPMDTVERVREREHTIR